MSLNLPTKQTLKIKSLLCWDLKGIYKNKIDPKKKKKKITTYTFRFEGTLTMDGFKLYPFGWIWTYLIFYTEYILILSSEKEKITRGKQTFIKLLKSF